MSRYEDLQKIYGDAVTANDQYWHELRQMIVRIRSDFSNYLGVGSDPIDVAGVKRPIVAIGNVDEQSNFKNWSIDSLPKQGSSIAFSLCLSFPYASDAEPRPDFVYELLISKTEEGYLVVRPGWQDETFIGPQFNALFDHLISATSASIQKACRL